MHSGPVHPGLQCTRDPPPGSDLTWLATDSATDLKLVGKSSEANVSPTAQAPLHPSLPAIASATCRHVMSKGQKRSHG